MGAKLRLSRRSRSRRRNQLHQTRSLNSGMGAPGVNAGPGARVGRGGAAACPTRTGGRGASDRRGLGGGRGRARRGRKRLPVIRGLCSPYSLRGRFASRPEPSIAGGARPCHVGNGRPPGRSGSCARVAGLGRQVLDKPGRKHSGLARWLCRARNAEMRGAERQHTRSRRRGMASSSSAKAGERILPLAALDFSSGVFGIDPLVRRRAGEGASEVTLEDEMRHHGVFFDQLLTMIPAQYYLKDEEAAEEQWKSRFWRVSASLRRPAMLPSVAGLGRSRLADRRPRPWQACRRGPCSVWCGLAALASSGGDGARACRGRACDSALRPGLCPWVLPVH